MDYQTYNPYGNDPFSVCFNVMKIRYVDYDTFITEARFLQDEREKVNVFINLETIFKSLCMIRDLEDKLIMQKKFPLILLSNMINLAGHYKRFFVNAGLDTRVYLYHTDLDSDCEDFSQACYDDEYRAYYLTKYTANPKFLRLMDALRTHVLPGVRTICQFIPDVHYISSKNIEGSLVPYVIGQVEPERKNFIISEDFYESQYGFLPNFFDTYIHSSFKKIFCNNYMQCLEAIANGSKNRSREEMESFYSTYNWYGMYCSLITVLGDKMRSISGISGYGPSTLERAIKRGLYNHEIQLDTTSPELIGTIFQDEEIKEDFIGKFHCLNVVNGYQKMTDADKLSITNQIVNRIDVNSLQNLNAGLLQQFPITLEALL